MAWLWGPTIDIIQRTTTPSRVILILIPVTQHCARLESIHGSFSILLPLFELNEWNATISEASSSIWKTVLSLRYFQSILRKANTRNIGACFDPRKKITTLSFLQMGSSSGHSRPHRIIHRRLA